MATNHPVARMLSGNIAQPRASAGILARSATLALARDHPGKTEQRSQRRDETCPDRGGRRGPGQAAGGDDYNGAIAWMEATA